MSRTSPEVKALFDASQAVHKKLREVPMNSPEFKTLALEYQVKVKLYQEARKKS